MPVTREVETRDGDAWDPRPDFLMASDQERELCPGFWGTRTSW